MFAQFQRLPNPRQPLPIFCLRQILETVLRHCPGKNQAIPGAGGGHVEQAHALELFAPPGASLQLVKKRAAHHLATSIGNLDAQTFARIENERRIVLHRFAMQIRNDYDGKLLAFGLMNRHQMNDVRRFVHLPFALAAADGFELFDVTDKVTNQIGASLFKAFGQKEKLLDIRNALRSVEVRGDYGQIIRRRNRTTKELSDAVAVSPLNHQIQKSRTAIELRAIVFVNELNLAMIAYSAEQVASRQSSRPWVLSDLWRAAQREQRIVRDAAQRRTQHGRERYFVGGVVEKPEQLNQIGD